MSDKPPFKHGDFCWNELITPNPEEAKQFYQSLLGWEFEAHDINPETPYTMIKNGETTLGGIMQTPKGQESQMPPYWGSYISVDDLEATVEKAKSLGARVMIDITPVGNFGRFAMIQDPTGATVSLWHCAPQSDSGDPSSA